MYIFFLQSLLVLPLSDKRQNLLQPFHQLTCSVGTTGLAEKAFPEKLGHVQWLKRGLKVVIPLLFTPGKVQLDSPVEPEPPQSTEGVGIGEWASRAVRDRAWAPGCSASREHTRSGSEEACAERDAQSSCGISILGVTQNLTKPGHDQQDLSSPCFALLKVNTTWIILKFYKLTWIRIGLCMCFLFLPNLSPKQNAVHLQDPSEPGAVLFWL